MDLDATDGPETKTKKVSFAMDTTAGGSVEAEAEPATKLDGVIGQLEIYRSGAVKMRIGDNILYDVRLSPMDLNMTRIILCAGNCSYSTLVPSTCCPPRYT